MRLEANSGSVVVLNVASAGPAANSKQKDAEMNSPAISPSMPITNYNLASGPVAPAFLPAAARDKLESLRAHRDDLTATARALSDQLTRARQRVYDAEDAVRRIGQHRADQWPYDANDARRLAVERQRDENVKEAAEAAVVEARETFAAIQGRLGARQARLDPIRALVSRLDEYVDGLPRGEAVLSHPGVSAQLGRGENPADAVTKVRASIDGLREDIDTVKRAPLPRRVLKELARAEVARLAEGGEPNLTDFLRNGRSIGWPHDLVMGKSAVATDKGGIMVGSSTLSLPSSLAMMALVAGDALIAYLDRQIDARVDDSVALDAKARVAREREIVAKILAFERREEALIDLAAAQGIEIMRREDADPRAVLGLADDMMPPAD